MLLLLLRLILLVLQVVAHAGVLSFQLNPQLLCRLLCYVPLPLRPILPLLLLLLLLLPALLLLPLLPLLVPRLCLCRVIPQLQLGLPFVASRAAHC